MIDTVYDGISVYLSVDPPVLIDSGFIYLYYPFYVDEYGDTVCLFVDQPPPLAGTSPCMERVRYEYLGDSTG